MLFIKIHKASSQIQLSQNGTVQYLYLPYPATLAEKFNLLLTNEEFVGTQMQRLINARATKTSPAYCEHRRSMVYGVLYDPRIAARERIHPANDVHQEA